MDKPLLYDLGISPTSQRVVATLTHKGIDYDFAETDVTQKERPAAFNAVSPFGKIPVLVHNGCNLIESVVINEYIEEVWPAPAMLPAAPEARAYARQWIAFFNRAVTDREGEFVHIERDRDRKVEICRKILPELAIMDRELRTRNGLFLGEELSLVDVAIAPFTRGLAIWAELLGDSDYPGFESLHAYFGRLEANPVLKQTVYNIPDEVLTGFHAAVLNDGLTVP